MEIKVCNLSKKYKDFYAVEHVNYCFCNGIYALLGPNGAGKTTLMDMICGVLQSTEGEILSHNVNILHLGDKYRSLVGYLPQHPPFYLSFTARDFLKYVALLKGVPKERISAEISNVLSFVNLETAADKKVGAFSGGMKQRLGIAQALINSPEIIILDEPTAGLDPKERMHLKNIIAGISRNKIIIISTHIVSDIEELAQQIILMNKGKILIADNADNLKNSINGKVWLVNSDSNSGNNCNARLVKGIEESQGFMLRLIKDEKPNPDAIMAKPTLDDVYLYHFGGGEEKNEF